jgi:hypothetical protein
MFLIAALLPKSFLTWLEAEVRTRVERMLGLTDRQLDLAEKELGARHRFVGIKPAKVISIEDAAE